MTPGTDAPRHRPRPSTNTDDKSGPPAQSDPKSDRVQRSDQHRQERPDTLTTDDRRPVPASINRADRSTASADPQKERTCLPFRHQGRSWLTHPASTFQGATSMDGFHGAERLDWVGREPGRCGREPDPGDGWHMRHTHQSPRPTDQSGPACFVPRSSRNVLRHPHRLAETATESCSMGRAGKGAARSSGRRSRSRC